MEWLALNASVSRVGEQMGCLFRLSRVASSEAKFPLEPRPAEGSTEGGLERGRVGLFPRVGPLPSSEAETERTAGGIGGEASSEAEIVPRVREGASDGPYRGTGPWAE